MNPSVAAFIMDGGEVFEILDLPEDLGRACALASEATLRKFWDTPEKCAAWQKHDEDVNVLAGRRSETPRVQGT